MIDVEQLRSKILDLAISGKLVPQDPNDEPASVLLERIQKEKEALVKDRKIKKADPPSIIYKGSDNRYYEKAHSFQDPIDISDEIPCSLPEGWAWTRLSNICASIEYGLSYSAKKDGENKYLRITDIQDGEVNWKNVPYVTIVPGEERFYLRSGDIVFARTGATVGKSFLITKAPERSVFASYLIRISPIDCHISQYISYFFGSSFYWKQITNTSVGTGQPNCNGTKLSNLLIPFPPLKTQEKINTNLQNLLSVLTRMNQEQKRIGLIAQALKREILKTFFASDKSYYEFKPLSEIAEITMGQSVGSEEMLSTCQNGSFEFHQGKTHFGKGVLFSSNIYVINPRKIALPNSILMCVRAPVGDVIFCDRKIAIGRGLCSISPHKDTDINFLFYFLLFSKNWFILQSTGSTFQAITIKTVKTLRVPVFRYEKETEIAKEIRIIFSQIDKLID